MTNEEGKMESLIDEAVASSTDGRMPAELLERAHRYDASELDVIIHKGTLRERDLAAVLLANLELRHLAGKRIDLVTAQRDEARLRIAELEGRLEALVAGDKPGLRVGKVDEMRLHHVDPASSIEVLIKAFIPGDLGSIAVSAYNAERLFVVAVLPDDQVVDQVEEGGVV